MATFGPDVSATDLLGREFGPYTLVQRLGVGGMAETFEAIRHGRSGFTQHVCLKLIRPAFREDDDSIELFEREARLAAKLQHSNIVGMIDFGEIDGTIYMALELVDGVDLQLLLDVRHRLSSEHVALVGHELAAALEHAHNPSAQDADGEPGADGVIHRDISPSNVMVSRYGEIKLTDFGLANLAAAGSRQSEVRGKFPYMAPERLRADPLDGRADLFSLGVVLFEALAGRRPFDGGNDPATIMLITEGDHPPLAELAPDAPPELCRTIERLIEKERDQRPTTAGALVNELEALVPSPSARRKLGKYATSAKSHRTVHKPISSRRLAESELPEPMESTTTTGSNKESSFRRWLVAGAIIALFALGLGSVGVNLWGSGNGAIDPATTEDSPAAAPEANEIPSSTANDEGPARLAGEEPTEASPVATESASDAPAPPRPARLTVQVAPWGEVWINGKARGTAPLKSVSLKPGRYKISVGQDEPMQTRVVRLREGQKRTIRFDLTE